MELEAESSERVLTRSAVLESERVLTRSAPLDGTLPNVRGELGGSLLPAAELPGSDRVLTRSKPPLEGPSLEDEAGERASGDDPAAFAAAAPYSETLLIRKRTSGCSLVLAAELSVWARVLTRSAPLDGTLVDVRGERAGCSLLPVADSPERVLT